MALFNACIIYNNVKMIEHIVKQIFELELENVAKGMCCYQIVILLLTINIFVKMLNRKERRKNNWNAVIGLK
jgi:hypothetical protein